MQELRETTSRLVNNATGGGCLSRELPGEHRPRERWSVMSYGRRRGLRPVSPYVIVLALAVALTASFFLPTRAEAAFPDHTVTTISPSGTTINLFDYWVNPDNHLSVSGNGGINKNHRFQFKDQGASEELNQYTGGSRVRTGIVNNVLAGGYPKLTNRWEGESLGYLFDSSVQTGKISHMGVTGLLQAEGGYYEYDSSRNYAAYNANKNAFDVYNAAGVMQAGAEPHSVGQFFPFDAADKVFKEEDGKLVPNGITSQNNGPLNHYFGLSMSSRFVQPKDGKTNADKPMTFEFAGDDDVWVFIDDVLVGDIGGIHTSADLTINFQTGDISVNNSANGTLKSKFKDAGRDTSGFNGNTFAGGTNHTLKFFYLERGATDSNMKLKFNLVTVPESDIIKFDQDGGLVEGAQFALYKTDKSFADTTTNSEKLLGSGTTDANGQLTLTNKVDNGVINFDDLYSKDHNCRYYLLKETKVPEGHRSSLTATDGSIQFEYVPASDENGAGGVIINRGGMDADSSVWQSGAFAGSKETITAPSTVYKANDDLTKSNETVSPGSGILFAVVLKRDKSASTGINDPNNWYAVSGDPTKGYTLAKDQGKLGAIEAAKKDLYAFTLNTSGQYQVEIPYLPGDISKYYYLLSGDARKDAEYTVAIYYTTASSIADADELNTVHVFSDDHSGDQVNFKRQFATRLLVTNIQNRLFVQKTDTEGNPVDGAKFGLYTADQVTTDANGKVVLKGEQTPYDTLTTGSVGNPVPLEGAGIFPNTSAGNMPLVNGTYFLKEVSAPKGFLLNDTLTKVIVDDYGVHADAGTDDDGVSTFVGPGALMKSLGQFGAEGDIDNTLTWIKGMRQTSDGVKDNHGNLSWSNVDPAGAGDTVHLKYGANGRIYQYGPTEEGKPYRLETETGWIRMGITQDEQPKGITAKGARADLGAMNLNALFTGATCVRVANEREASLEVTKKVVVPDGLTGNKDAGFTFKFTVPKGKTYKAAVFEKAGTVDEKQVGNVFDLTNGYSQTIKADETIRVYGLGEGDEYTVQELTGADEMPAGYKLTGRKQGDENLTGAGDGIITGKIAKQNIDGTLAEDNKLVFTNSYSVKSSVTLTGIRAQKVLQGRKWTKADSFDIYLRAAKGTPMPGGYKDVSGVPGYVQVVKTVNNGDEFDFGQITYKKPGTYTYTVAERTPDEHDSSWLPGFGYSSAGYTVTVQVDDTGRGTLSEPVVTMARNGDDDGAHHDPAVPVDNKVAVFTNKFSTDTKTISFNAQKSYTDESGDNPLAAGKFTFELKALGGLANSAVGAAPIKFNDLSYTVSANDAPMPADGVTTAENDGGGIAAFPQITFTAADQNTTYVYQVTEQAGSDASTTGGMTYDTTVYYAMVQNTLDDKGQLSSTATYWKADGTQLTDTGGYIPFKNTYTVAQTMSAPVTVQKTLAGRAWEQDDKFDFTLTPADDATMKAVADGVVSQKTGEDDKTGKLTTDAKITSTSAGDATRVAAFGSSDLVFTKPGTYTFNVNETKPTDANKTGIAYDDHTSTVTYTVTDLDKDGKHTGKLTASVAYDNKQATTDADRQVTGAAAFTNTYTASGTYAGIDVTKTLVGTPLENGMFPFTIKAMTYNGTKAPEPVDSDKSFMNTVGKDDGDDTQTATMSGKLKMNFTQLSYNKMYVYKVSEVHDANAGGYTYDTEYPGDAYVLIAVKPNLDNKGQLYTETTIVKGPDVTALVGVGDNVDALTAEAIKGLNTTTNYVQTVSSRGAKPATPIVPFKNVYKVETIEYGAKAGLQIEKKFTGTGDASSTFSFTVTPEDYQAEGQDGTKFILTSADAAAKKLDITGGAETFKIPEMKLGDTKTVSLLPKGLQFTHDDVSNEYRANVYQYRVEENVPKPVPAGYTYDKTVYTVEIAVSDNGDGTLKVETTVLNSDGKRVDYREFNPGAPLEDNTATVPFENSYKTDASDELTPQVTKKVSGTESTDKEFSFTLAATSETKDKIAAGDLEAGGLKGDASSESKTTKGEITGKDGQTLNFSGMKFNKAGDYTFTLTEAHGEDDDPNTAGVQNAGWTMDDSTYAVTVKVEDKNAKLTVTGVAVKKDGDDKSETPEVKDGKVNLATFTNSYAAKGSVTLAAKKLFTGGALAGNEFSFALYKGDKAEGTPIETVTNDEDGNITFQPINYTEAGDYKYTIKEVTGNDQTIVYDAREVKVKVSVTDNKNGTLGATVTYDGDEAVPTFTNARPTADATIEAKKTLTGKDLTEGAFIFGLYQGDASTGNPVQLAQNDKDGKINLALTGLTIGEYDYTLKEENVGADPTITYDTKAVKVHVSVKAEGGKAKATVTYDGKNDIPTFENTYQPAGTSVALTAKKTYVKSDSTPAALKGGEFAFNLYEGDLTAEQLKDKQPIQTAENGEDGTVTFPAINYTKAGEYKYTIVEKKGDLSHVTFDDTVHHAVVKVVDNAGKLEASVTYDDGKTDAPTFKNTYTAKGSVELTATKVVAVAPGFTHDTKLKGGEYTFELKDADGKVLDTATNKADGIVKFTRDFELSDLDGAASKDFTYTIVEQPGAEPGMVYDTHALTYTVKVTDGGNGALNAKAIVTSTSGPETFTNIYQPAATGLALGAQKSYVKKDDNTPIVLKVGEFTFDVYEGNLTAEQLAGAEPVRTATNGADGSVNFDAFSYAKPGTHEYTIVERKGDLAYVTYDAAVHHAVVTVADNAGTLQASVAYDGTDATKPTFTNTYEAQATDSGAIALTKSVNVHDGSYQLKAGDFAFELMGSDGSVIQTQKNDADGKVAFDKLTFDHAGTFTYTVREVQPTDDAPGVPGVTYTGKTYTLTYVVKDNNDGKLVVESSTVKPSEGPENGVSPGTMVFANSYQPGQTSYRISGTKVLKNADPATTRTPADGEFTFALIDVATGQEIDRTTNVGNAFTFKAISYTATGSHEYQVKEVTGQDATITYSDAVLDVTVSVTDDGSGQLTATANKTAADLTFTNTYTPTATTATITGTKALTGRDLAEGEFSFDLKDADGNVVQTVQNGADGTFGFAPLQLDKVGTYVYTVSERAGATANGVTYDATVFTATVTVTENAETHELEAQVAYSTGGKAADAVAFCNSYAPAATEVKLGASKVLSGEDLKEGQFSFQLKDTDGKVLQTAKNAADGTVGFEAISYDKPGTYAYSISEVDDSQKNVTYDATEHQVTVTVTDDGAGHLVATVAYGGDVAPVFKNTYTPPTTPPMEPPANPPSKSPVPKEEKPGLPNMGDTSLSPMALGGIAGGAVVLIAAGVILRRRNR